ncbi:MAG: dienelactone hydrolase family protein [Sediminibacterium sp. Gen4]|jgi:carboxymethylenebutenolidase|uniref:dienelactone hydrolase family protein n=1 Tax=unclassified Sediminibacterium TaxID=2635961 RepID=UPI0015BC14C8|nr:MULTISPECIES: dienelactone hydrolase family protein [unclassified Sediminibacterium]MBW0162227.1 dienelactone hydrolase family protein [Sediminibacterium sp.]MBW0162921.1 dienelactone hydrolase family protein [Sediminibacterium sp.]NWK67218.1 dienelactone hydrolase family protein [Sediminibacterium sp. Gen4]
MKKLIALTFAAFCTAAFLSYSYKTPAPQPLTSECYVSCFTSEIMDQFKAEASTASFAMMHDNPIPYVAADPLGKAVTFKAADGSNAMGYEIRSKKKSNKWLFVIQEWWGLNDYIKKESETYYNDLEDVNVIALDLYDGKIAATADSAMKLIQSVKTDRLESIIKGAIAYAGTDAKIYTVGWCFGGMWSLQSTLLAGKQAAGCVMFYGRPENNVEKLKTLNCDVIGFFGNKDRSPSPEVVNKFEADMQAAGKKLIANKYDAGHGFANPSNPVFNKEAAADAHAKAVAFLKERM